MLFMRERANHRRNLEHDIYASMTFRAIPDMKLFGLTPYNIGQHQQDLNGIWPVAFCAAARREGWLPPRESTREVLER